MGVAPVFTDPKPNAATESARGAEHPAWSDDDVLRELMDMLGNDEIDHAELYSREPRKPVLGELPYKALTNNDNGGPGRHRFRQEINALAAGSPARVLHILSYGLANPRTTKLATSSRYRRRGCGSQGSPGE